MSMTTLGSSLFDRIFAYCFSCGDLASVALVLAFVVYMSWSYVLFFLPLHVARRRGRSLGSVGALNILLGWTGVGWVAALALSLRGGRDA